MKRASLAALAVLVAVVQERSARQHQDPAHADARASIRLAIARRDGGIERGRLGPGARDRSAAAPVQTTARRLRAFALWRRGSIVPVEHRHHRRVRPLIPTRGAAGVRLIVQVEERPLIAGVDFEGLERVSGGRIRDTLGLGTEQALNPNLVVKTEQMIRDMLAAEGVQLVSVDTALAPVPERPSPPTTSCRAQ